MNSTADHESDRYCEGPRKQVLIAVTATARPIEFSANQLIRSNHSQVAPQGAQQAGNQLAAGNDAGNAINTNEKTGYTQEHSDNCAGIDETTTGRYGFAGLEKFVDLRALRTALVLLYY